MLTVRDSRGHDGHLYLRGPVGFLMGKCLEGWSDQQSQLKGQVGREPKGLGIFPLVPNELRKADLRDQRGQKQESKRDFL